MMEECQPVVSVVMPCHNDGAYLHKAVDSALNQTFTALEVLVVDDGSDDEATCAALAGLKDSRVRLLHTDHAGPAQARNAAIREARGRYILPLDADDWISPEYVARAVEVLDSRPEVGVVYCRADLFGEKSGPWRLPDFSMDTFLVDNCIFITALFRREDWEAVGGFCPDFRHGLEDYDFWLSLVERGRQVHQLPECFFHYRIKPASRSRQLTSDVRNTQATYDLLYQRHRALYQAHMDACIQGLRRELIVQRYRNDDTGARAGDPVAECWQSIRLGRPRLARAVERLVCGAQGARKALRRMLAGLRRR